MRIMRRFQRPNVRAMRCWRRRECRLTKRLMVAADDAVFQIIIFEWRPGRCVMVLDRSSFAGPYCSERGSKIDLAESLGHNGKGWRYLAVGLGLSLEWTLCGILCGTLCALLEEWANHRMYAALPFTVW